MSPERNYSKRSANFNSCEIEFLIQTVTKYRDVIESKKTDRSSTEEKTKAWKDVEREFNAQFGNFSFRTLKVLKTKYINLKKNAKKSIRYIRESNAASTLEDTASLEQMAYMDESQFSTDKYFSDTVREYFEETFTENDNSKSPWHETEEEHEMEDEDIDLKEKVSFEVSDGPLLVPMLRKSVENGPNDFTISKQNRKTYPRSLDSGEAVPNNNFIAKTERHPLHRTQEREEPAYSRHSRNSHYNGMIEHSPRRNSRKEPSQPTNSIQNKTSIQLFCDSLAMQIEEANLTSYQLSSLQIDLLKKLQEYLPTEN